MSVDLNGSLQDFGNIMAAIGALGTASFGLVDATKVYRGGVSNIGFGFIQKAVEPYQAALRLVNADDPLSTVKANWINGVAKSDQKAAVKSLIRLGITTATAADLAASAPGIDNAALVAVAQKIDGGLELSEEDINLLGRFDAILDAQMDAGFERADQQYRNAAKMLASVFAILLSLAGMWILKGQMIDGGDTAVAFFLGILSIPLAPIAKDLTSALGTAVSALKAAKG